MEKKFIQSLNNHYSDMPLELVIEKLDYLTVKSRGKHTIKNHIIKCYNENRCAQLLKRLDPIAFYVAFNEYKTY